MADELICNIHKYAEKQWKDLSCLTGVISCLPELICLLNDLSHKAATLEGLFDAVEKELIELEDVIDARKFHKKEEEQRLQLVLHKERRLAMLQNLKCKLL